MDPWHSNLYCSRVNSILSVFLCVYQLYINKAQNTELSLSGLRWLCNVEFCSTWSLSGFLFSQYLLENIWLLLAIWLFLCNTEQFQCHENSALVVRSTGNQNFWTVITHIAILREASLNPVCHHVPGLQKSQVLSFRCSQLQWIVTVYSIYYTLVSICFHHVLHN